MSEIERIREFNRFYTQRLGVLTDHYLGQDRPLGQARLLFEIGAGSDVRELRERLGLDSGYLSRMLKALADQQLIAVRAHPGDRRVRIAELTDTAGPNAPNWTAVPSGASPSCWTGSPPGSASSCSPRRRRSAGCCAWRRSP